MKAITVRGIEPDVAVKLKEIASKENKSLNQLLLDLIEIRVGMKKEKKFTRRYDDLDSLFGKWSQQDFAAIQAKIDAERHIDPEIWK
ncbi:MAG TPA: antitoxin [Desulfotignum sp.]|nr:antitoxin [Desulfotignum sp.]